MTGKDHPRPQLDKFTDLQKNLAKLTTYDWDNQQFAFKSLLPERYSRLTETHYENSAHFVNVVSNYWVNYVQPQIAAAVQRNQLKHAQHAATVAGIDGRNNGDSGGGGKGGNGNGKKQQVRTYPRGGNGKQQQQQQPRQQQGKNMRDRNGNIKTCWFSSKHAGEWPE